MKDLLQQASREMRTMPAVCLRVMTDTNGSRRFAFVTLPYQFIEGIM